MNYVVPISHPSVYISQKRVLVLQTFLGEILAVALAHGVCNVSFCCPWLPASSEAATPLTAFTVLLRMGILATEEFENTNHFDDGMQLLMVLWPCYDIGASS